MFVPEEDATILIIEKYNLTFEANATIITFLIRKYENHNELTRNDHIGY